MPRFDANLSFLFTELPLERRFEAAAAAGFRAVEINLPEPYTHSPAIFSRWLSDAGLQSVLFLAPGGDLQKGELGITGLPGREAEFRWSLHKALEYAAASATPMLHVLACRVPEGVERRRCEEVYLENLGFAADTAKAAGVTICIEPVARARFSNYLVNTTAHALDLIRRLGRSDIYLIWDAYQAQVEEGNLGSTLRNHLPSIAHIQVGNPPGRHEPGRGEIDFGFLFDLIDELQYAGWVGAEYYPSHDTWSSLEWARRFGISAAPRQR